MLKSMTAYGRYVLSSDNGHCVVEIQSVNKRFLEVHVNLPRDLSFLEREVKKWIARKVKRGMVSVSVSLRMTQEKVLSVQPNLNLVRQLKEAWLLIQKEWGPVKDHSPDYTLLAGEKDLFSFEEQAVDEGFCKEVVKESLDKALEGLVLMKFEEGEALKKEFLSRLELIKGCLESIRKKAPYATEKYRSRLIATLNDFLSDHVENEERVLREVAVYAERVDITEELTRFCIHHEKFASLLHEKSESIGKTLEFLVQEMHREINTVGSKASDAEVSHWVIEIKSELEKVREQIQNVE